MIYVVLFCFWFQITAMNWKKSDLSYLWTYCSSFFLTEPGLAVDSIGNGKQVNQQDWVFVALLGRWHAEASYTPNLAFGFSSLSSLYISSHFLLLVA